MKKLFLLMVGLMLGFTAAAQTVVTGQVVDENQLPLIGANVLIPGTTQGTTTDINGSFTIQVGKGADAIQISFLNYKTATHKVNTSATRQNLGTIELAPDAIKMDDVVITQSIAVQRKTPVAVSTVSASEIEYKIGGQEFPEVLKSTPGVYVTKGGGGFGDSKINMRGFKSANVAVMVNGVPMNDMEWGGVYWSNWAGLSDVTRSMQTQRGMGASKISAPSVGGTINIVTNSIDAKRGGTFTYGVGNDGLQNISVSLSTGLSKKGWAMSVLLGKRWGDGYIQGTNFEGYNWFVNISKRINDRHQLSLTAFGAPQTHNKRDELYGGLSIKQWETEAKKYMGEKDMYRYNAAFGYDMNGKAQTGQEYNHYHKPQISLNHQWQINYKSSLSTALYVSIGRGGGYSGQGYTSADRQNWRGANYGTLNKNYRKADGTFDYAKVQMENTREWHEANNPGSPYVGSKMVMSDARNEHMWYGLLSTYTNQISESLELSAGVDARYYIGTHYNEIVDLYGGEFFIDYADRVKVNPANNIAAADPTWAYDRLGVGDKVYKDYDGHVHQEGVFAQLEWTKRNLNAFVSGSLSNTGYWRVDRFYYDAAHQESEKLNFLGFTAKGGANWNFTPKSNVFLNVGYISRAPIFSGGAFMQKDVSNMTNPDAVNEKIFSVEGGYGFRSGIFSMNLNAYYTLWMDKALTRSSEMSNGDIARVNMTGVDARHMGIELDFRLKPSHMFNITGMLSIGDWVWNSNTRGYIYDSQGQPMTRAQDGTVASGIMADDHAFIEVNQKDIPVAGSAQTTAALGVDFFPMKGLRVSADWNVYDRNYADFYIPLSATSISSINVNKPWRIPWGHQLDLSASYNFKIGNLDATIYGNVNNIYNYQYVMDAQCATSATSWEDCYGVLYSFGRTYTLRLKIRF